MIRRVCLGAVSLLAACVTPIVVDESGFRLGIHYVRVDQTHPHVTYRKVVGLGLGVYDGRFQIGFLHSERVEADIEGKSYWVTTPIVTFAVGKEAEKGGTRFLRGTIEGEESQ